MRTGRYKPSPRTLRLREEMGRLAQSLRWGWDYELGRCYPGAVRDLQDSEREDMLHALKICSLEDVVRRVEYCVGRKNAQSVILDLRYRGHNI